MIGRRIKGLLYMLLFCASVGATAYAVVLFQGKMETELQNNAKLEEQINGQGEVAQNDIIETEVDLPEATKEQAKRIMEDTITTEDLKGQAQYVDKEPHVDENQPIAAAVLDEDRIVSTTKILFREKVEGSKKITEIVTNADAMYLHLTRDQVQEMHPDYQLQSFSDELVVFYKVIPTEEVDLGNTYFIQAKDDQVFCYLIDGYDLRKVGEGYGIYTNDGKRVNEEALLQSVFMLPESLAEEEKQRYYKGFPCDTSTYISIGENFSS